MPVLIQSRMTAKATKNEVFTSLSMITVLTEYMIVRNERFHAIHNMHFCSLPTIQLIVI